jgi:hypothetical protein
LAVALIARGLLERQSDQVAESSMGQRVLAGEEPIVRIQADIRTTIVSVRTWDPSARARAAGIADSKNIQNVGAPTGSRALERGGETQPVAAFEKSSRVLEPTLPVEIDR